MKYLLALVVLFPALAGAQAPVVYRTGRPSFALMGRESMPMMIVDEAALGAGRFERLTLPPKYWTQMKACVAGLGLPTNKAGAPPEILVVPVARTFRMHDMTVDSLMAADDSTFYGEHWSAPTIGYALMRSGVIVITAEYQKNPYVLRHEALHFILWRQFGVLGHPIEFFGPCDELYEGGDA
jgi:hypothetical protein